MISRQALIGQLKSINVKYRGWGRTEIFELPGIILPGEKIYECANGIYASGFALLVATDVRLLLIDKKPLNYLTVEDMRFDMINEIDYNHRLFGADITIVSGGKTLHFTSYNQSRLRKLIGHVQNSMAEVKQEQASHQDSQVSHLRQINQQLQAYLRAQYDYQEELKEFVTHHSPESLPTPPKPSNELSNYLYARSLVNDYNTSHHTNLKLDDETSNQDIDKALAVDNSERDRDIKEIYDEGRKEVFGVETGRSQAEPLPSNKTTYDLTPEQVAYSKLPTILNLRRRKIPSQSV